MFRKIAISVLLLFVFLSVASAGGSQEKSSQEKASQEQISQEQISQEQVSQDMRVVSLGPNTTEIICALGAEDLLVGRTDQCNYPSSVISLPSIGGAWNVSAEKILSLNPTLVIVPYELDSQIKSILENAGIQVEGKYLENSTDGVFSLISFVGANIGKEKEADKLNKEIASALEEVRSSVEGLPRPTVYIVISYGSFDSTATGETFLNELISIAGGTNVAGKARGWQYSKELLISDDPEYIIIIPTTDNPEKEIRDFSSAPPYSSLSAVKNGKVFCIDADIASRQGPRIAEAARAIREIIHE